MDTEEQVFVGEDQKYGSPEPDLHSVPMNGDAPEADEHDGLIAFADLGARLKPGTGPARDLLLDGQLITIVGEEGDGKTTFGTQIACQLVAGDDIGGHFEVVEPVAPVLIVDVEQSEEDAVIVRDDMFDRGLKVDGVFWLSASGRSFDTFEDQKWLTRYVRALRPKVVVVDTGTEAVADPNDSKSVKPMMIYLRRLMSAEGVRTVVMLAQPRKRSQEAVGPRKFDDLFGSRVWKGQSSTVLYLEQHQITVWKQRGSYIRRRWDGVVGRLERSDTEPTIIREPQPAAEAEDERRTQITVAVGTHPEKYSKSSLIEDELQIPGRSRAPWRRTIDDMLEEGLLEAVGQYNKLRLTDSPPSPPHSAR